MGRDIGPGHADLRVIAGLPGAGAGGFGAALPLQRRQRAGSGAVQARPSTRIEKSTARTSFVSRPIEMRSTPVAAMSRN